MKLFDNPALPLPAGVSESKLFEWLRSVKVEGGGQEMENYLRSDFRRFVYTFGLTKPLDGTGRKALEFGSNPYFSTFLLRQFTSYEWAYSNYFGSQQGEGVFTQNVAVRDFHTGVERVEAMPYHHFNSEVDSFPFADGTFGLVLYCEILEHLLNDPCSVLRSIHNLLSDGGHLVLTTPNVARLENVLRLADGVNMYDPYSGYGPYGRHNREYTCAELKRLLTYMGFEVEELFTADVHPLQHQSNAPEKAVRAMLGGRRDDLGQYIFIRARKAGPSGGRKPAWLYRSLPPAVLAQSDDDKVGSLAAHLSPLNNDRLKAGRVDTFRFRVSNVGAGGWDLPELIFGARVYAADGRVVREFRGTPIDRLDVGSEMEVSVEVDLRDLPRGRLEVVFDVVNEHHFWFADVGSQPLKMAAS